MSAPPPPYNPQEGQPYGYPPPQQGYPPPPGAYPPAQGYPPPGAYPPPGQVQYPPGSYPQFSQPGGGGGDVHHHHHHVNVAQSPGAPVIQQPAHTTWVL